MKLSEIRKIVRWLHIFEGAFIVSYFYTPLGNYEIIKYIISYFILPLIVLSGVWLWKGHLLYKK